MKIWIACIAALLLQGVRGQSPVHFILETGQPPELVANAGNDVSTDASVAVVIGESPAALGGTTPYSYVWVPGTGLDNPTLETPTLTTSLSSTYYLFITDANGCTAKDSLYVDVTIGQGSTPTPVAGSLVVYPNPTSRLLRIVVSDDWIDGDLRAKLVDANGKTLFTREWTGVHTSVELDLTGAAAGDYVLQLSHGHETMGRKIQIHP